MLLLPGSFALIMNTSDDIEYHCPIRSAIDELHFSSTLQSFCSGRRAVWLLFELIPYSTPVQLLVAATVQTGCRQRNCINVCGRAAVEPLFFPAPLLRQTNYRINRADDFGGQGRGLTRHGSIDRGSLWGLLGRGGCRWFADKGPEIMPVHHTVIKSTTYGC